MELDRSVEELSDDEVLATFGTARDPENWGFDEETQARVLAHELLKARGRLTHYRTLYATFAPEGRRYMIENLADDDSAGLPLKLAFTDDDAQAEELLTDDDVTVWTETELLDALRQELLLHDYFTDLLDELLPA